MNESLQKYQQGFSDPYKIIFDPENLEYILRVHCGFTTSDLKNMSWHKGMRFALRAMHDLVLTRPDTYLSPLAEALPNIIQDTQDRSDEMIQSLKKDLRSTSSLSRMKSKAHPYKFQFPQTWVNPK